MNDKYYDTTESDLGTSIACHPSIYTVKLSFKDTRDSTVKALIHPFHRIITLRWLSVSTNLLIFVGCILYYDKTVTKILSFKRLHSITIATLPIKNIECMKVNFFKRIYENKNLISLKIRTICGDMNDLSF